MKYLRACQRLNELCCIFKTNDWREILGRLDPQVLCKPKFENLKCTINEEKRCKMCKASFSEFFSATKIKSYLFAKSDKSKNRLVKLKINISHQTSSFPNYANLFLKIYCFICETLSIAIEFYDFCFFLIGWRSILWI